LNYWIIYHIGSKQLSILTIRHSKQVLPISEIKIWPPRYFSLAQ
jgi:hypothetical protein